VTNAHRQKCAVTFSRKYTDETSKQNDGLITPQNGLNLSRDMLYTGSRSIRDLTFGSQRSLITWQKGKRWDQTISRFNL